MRTVYFLRLPQGLKECKTLKTSFCDIPSTVQKAPIPPALCSWLSFAPLNWPKSSFGHLVNPWPRRSGWLKVPHSRILRRSATTLPLNFAVYDTLARSEVTCAGVPRLVAEARWCISFPTMGLSFQLARRNCKLLPPSRRHPDFGSAWGLSIVRKSFHPSVWLGSTQTDSLQKVIFEVIVQFWLVRDRSDLLTLLAQPFFFFCPSPQAWTGDGLLGIWWLRGPRR